MTLTQPKTLLLTSLLVISSTLSAEHLGRFKVAVVKDTLGSQELVAGDFKSGLEQLVNAHKTRSSFNIAMGLCVAHLKQEALINAELSCSQAIEEAKTSLNNGKQGNLLKALAYSNRGIVRHLNKDDYGAFDDFTSAVLLSNSKLISDNLSIFKQAITVRVPSKSHIEPERSAD